MISSQDFDALATSSNDATSKGMQCLTDLRKAQTEIDLLIAYVGFLQAKRGMVEFNGAQLISAAESCVQSGIALPLTAVMDMAANRDIMNSIDLDNAESLRLQLQFDKKSVPANKKAIAPYGVFSIELPEEDRITIQENILMRHIAEAMRVAKNTPKVKFI